MSSTVHKIRCFRPFEGKKCSKELRKISDSIIQKLKTIGYSKASQINAEFRICSSCRIRVDELALSTMSNEQCAAGTSTMPAAEILPEVSSIDSLIPAVPSVPSIEAITISQPVNIEVFNRGISGIQVSPIELRKLNYVKYSENKSREINEKVRKNLFNLGPNEETLDQFNEIVENMKSKFSDSTLSRKEKMLILSMLPKSWTITKIINDFNASRYIVNEAREVCEVVIGHSSTTRKSGTALSEETKHTVLQFYEDDDVSRAMPGQRDYVSVKKDGKRQAVQKRLLMMTLRESYQRFKEIHCNIKIGFSSFARLRPKQCKLLTCSGTHNVCVCTTHENINLILHSLQKSNITNDLKTLTDSLLCKNKTIYCYLRSCENCPGSSSLENDLLKQLEEKFIEQLTFEQWITTDRCDLETIVKPVDDFVSFFCLKLESLIPHDFIKTEQSNFLKTTRNNLKDGEFLVVCDFSENYSFVLQDEVQSHHWNVQQATIHPFVIYFKENMEVEHLSFIIISEDLRHDSVAVNLFISKLITFLRKNQGKIVNKIYFISDGAASQYKNRKNFSSLCKFKSNYGIEAEWHFFATSHGKGPCDAIGGTIKRMATRASLAKEREHPITNARELFNWANIRKEEDLTKLNFSFATTDQYEAMASELNEQYNNAKPIKGTQKFHSFIPVSECTIKAKLYSNCDESDAKIFNIVKKVSK